MPFSHKTLISLLGCLPGPQNTTEYHHLAELLTVVFYLQAVPPTNTVDFFPTAAMPFIPPVCLISRLDSAGM